MRTQLRMKSILAVVCIGLYVSTAVAEAQTSAPALTDVSKPFWKTGTMTGESVLFIKPEDNGQPTAPLLFTPRKILSVTSSDGRTVYREGKDYLHTAGSRDLTLPAGSTIPARTMKELTPAKNSQPFGLVRRDGSGDILFGVSHEYADMQVVVTYTYDATRRNGKCRRHSSPSGNCRPRSESCVRRPR